MQHSFLMHVLSLSRYLALLATQAAAAKKQSGEWATWEDAKWDPDGSAQLGLPRFYMMILYIHFYLNPAASNGSTPPSMRVAGSFSLEFIMNS